MVCFDNVLDGKLESMATAKTVDTVVDNASDELTTAWAEVDRAYQSLQRMRGVTRGSKPAETSRRKNKKRARTGLIN